MSLCYLGEPSGGDLSSPKRLTCNLSTSANPNSASRASYWRQRTDTLPGRVRKNSLDPALSEAWNLLKRQCCSICLETMDSSLWTRPSDLCAHQPKVCKPCLVKYLTHAINEGSTEIECPEVECRREMGYQDVEILVRGDQECLDRYNALVIQKELERQPNFVWCTNAQCGKGQIHNQEATTPIVICHHCDTRTCFVHRVSWHKKLTCDQYSKHEAANKASEEYINIHMKRCPNTGCKRPIEKVDGCDHMTCRRPGGCGYEFCWICLADYGPIRREGNHKHSTDCQHFAGRLQGHANLDVLPQARELQRHRTRCGWRTPVIVAPTIDIGDEPPARRVDTLIPPDSMGSPPPTPLSPVRTPPLISLLDMYASPLPDNLLSSHSPFPRRLYGGILPESTSSSLEPRVVVPSAGTSGSRRHCITGTIRSRCLTTIRRPPSPTTGDNLGSRLPTLVPHSGSLERARASLRDFQELISESVSVAPDRTRMARSSLEPSQVSSPSQRTGISCSSSTRQTQPQRSELYQPPPLPRLPRPPHPTSLAQPAPQVQHIQPRAFCPDPPRRVTPQESIIIQQGTQTREEPLRDFIPGRRLLSEQGEERHLSSIPDFESEILLDFIGCR